MNQLGASGIPFLFLIDFEAARWIVEPLDTLNAKDIAFNFNGKGNTANDAVLPSGKAVWFEKYPIAYDRYLEAFREVVAQQRNGNSFLTNLTFPTRIATNLSLGEIFQYSSARYKLRYQDVFVLFSPETFVQINDGTIASCPMKGTIDAHLPNAAQHILDDEKEKAEHATIVDLIRNDLSRVASQVQVERYRYIERIATPTKDLLQVSSRISGRLPEDYPCRLGDIFAALLPAGSISGAPKNKTLEIIAAAEGYKRGFYTGVCGCFDGCNVDSAVMIRFIEQTPEGLLYKSGGGITVYSDPEKEYQELIDKVYVPLHRNDKNTAWPALQAALA
ncbi:MAG: aminodeoxychorismate synthase component I [Saprospiraceae bacterium]|nr:aminodeoxychorismate synthase component I [Saprospiraceae bacterium]